MNKELKRSLFMHLDVIQASSSVPIKVPISIAMETKPFPSTPEGPLAHSPSLVKNPPPSVVAVATPANVSHHAGRTGGGGRGGCGGGAVRFLISVGALT